MDQRPRTTVQLHPTRRCNLACRHCYSLSGPDVADETPWPLLAELLEDARAQGYSRVSLSGGEPLLYPRLAELLDRAGGLGFARTLTTNGMPLDARRLALLAGRIELIAISLDGTPESHNRMRAHPRAFDTMAARLPALRTSGIPFGFIFTLTQHNLDEALWVAQFALEQGALLLQIHPLEEVGRAATELAGSRPDDQEAAFAFLLAERLKLATAGQLAIQLDLAHRRHLTERPEAVYADLPARPRADVPLAALVRQLVVETDGTVVPVQHGFPRAFAVGRLQDGRLPVLAAAWKRTRYAAFRRHCRALARGLASGPPVFNWNERAAQVA
jgi:MoaA/NifB/PqqE/SkfB family radical SAM enzyme